MKFILFPAILFSFVFAFGKTTEVQFKEKMKQLDAGFDGNIGVSIKDISNEKSWNYQADRPWYLSSTTKVYIAIAVYKDVEAGNVKLDQEVVLKDSDFVDGAGKMLYRKPGEKFKVSYLIEQMMAHSDSTATDMLVRLIGEEKLNKVVQQLSPGAGKFTTILQVRYDAYKELNEKAKDLSNKDYISMKSVPPSKRASEFAKKAKIPASELKYQSVDDAFETYYEKGMNSGSLTAFTDVLEKLSKGQLLSAEHTKSLMTYMQDMTTGENRLKAGLGKDLIFAQKTGTQIRRICNVGVIMTKNKEQKLSVAACAEKFADQKKAEQVLQKIGKFISEHPTIE